MASSLASIETNVEKFFKNTGTDLEKFGVEFERLFGKAPAALQSIDNFVNEAAPLITAATAIAAPAAEPEVAAALAIAETGLAALSASAKAAQSGTSVLTNLEAFATTVPATLVALQIKDPATQAKVTAVVNFVTAESKVLVPAVEAWVAQIKAASTPATA